MYDPSHPAERPSTVSSLSSGENRAWRSAGPRRPNRTIGFWLGLIGLGTVGCLFGNSMPYQQPLAVLISVAWWGVYFGCFGACLGALVGALLEPSPTPSCPQADDAAEPVMASAARVPRPAPPLPSTVIIRRLASPKAV
jgi:hypothetical protein